MKTINLDDKELDSGYAWMYLKGYELGKVFNITFLLIMLPIVSMVVLIMFISNFCYGFIKGVILG